MISELFITGLLSSVFSGVIANHADRMTEDTYKKIFENNVDEKLLNHDLQKAVINAFCNSVINISKNCISSEELSNEEISWLREHIKDFEKVIKQVEKNQFYNFQIDSFRRIVLLLSEDISSPEAIELENLLISYALEYNQPPKCYVENVKKFVYLNTKTLFAYEIKFNQAISNIFQSQLLTKIDEKIGMIENRISELNSSKSDNHIMIDVNDKFIYFIDSKLPEQRYGEFSQGFHFKFSISNYSDLLLVINNIEIEVQSDNTKYNFDWDSTVRTVRTQDKDKKHRNLFEEEIFIIESKPLSSLQHQITFFPRKDLDDTFSFTNGNEYKFMFKLSFQSKLETIHITKNLMIDEDAVLLIETAKNKSLNIRDYWDSKLAFYSGDCCEKII